MELATEIICVDCGGRAHLITPVPAEEELESGDVLVYRCADCLDRWDIVFERDDIEEAL
jgi:DNA-directed RNA polymerase subunit RPC12/RpoP